ncbi:hypothetical protein, partial [Paenibacillus macerans]|uniref:hypothetical protein n=1 Tax=Paenibacillus macerans TaxID=44252 RepID=UPI0022E25B6D
HSAVFFALSECTRVAFKSDKLHFLGTPKFKRLPQALFVPIPIQIVTVAMVLISLKTSNFYLDSGK